MTAMQIFWSGGGIAAFMWAINIIYQMAKGASSETSDF